MRKIKDRLARLALFCLIAFAIWLVSLCSAELLNTLAVCTFAGSIVMVVVLFCLCFKKRHVAMLLVALCIPGLVLARDREDCAASFKVSAEEGNYCVYEVLTENEGEELCAYVKTFNPSKVQQGEDATKLQARVNVADQLVQSYNDLDEAHQAEAGVGCHLISDTRDMGVSERLQYLQQNNTPMCCAWALQALNQIYTSQYSERQIQTVPMMLADDQMQCWPCDVIYLQIVLANTLAFKSAPAMAAASIFFLKWFFIFWIVIKVGMLFLNRNEQGKGYTAGDFFKELLIRSIWVTLIALILSGTADQYDPNDTLSTTLPDTLEEGSFLDQTYKDIVNPAFEIVAGFGIELTQTLLDGKKSFYGRVSEAVEAADASVSVYAADMNKVDYCQRDASGSYNPVHYNPMHTYLTQGGPFARKGLKLTGEGRVIQDDLTQGLMCLTQLAFRGSAPIAAVGSILTSHAINNPQSLPFPLPGSLPLMPQLFYGILLIILCWLIGVAVATRLIDILFRVAMVVILCPVFIAMAAFPLTREKYSKKAVMFFLSALMGFIEISIAVAFIVPFFYYGLAGNSNEEALIDAMVAPSNASYVPNLYAQFSDRGFKFFIFVCAVGWLSFKLLDSVQEFFDKIFGLKNMRSFASKATTSSLQKDVRASIGTVTDSLGKAGRMSRVFKRKFVRDNGLGMAIAGGIGSGAGKLAGHTASAGRRFFQAAKRSSAGRAASRVAYGTRSVYRRGKNFVKNNRVSRGMRAFGLGTKAVGQRVANSKIVNNKLTRSLGKVAAFGPKFVWNTAKRMAKTAPAVIKSQVKQGVHQFFHPKDDG